MLKLKRLAALLVAMIVSGGAIAADPAPAKIRVGVVPFYGTLPIWAGRDAGIFKSEGIDLDIVPTTGGATAIPAMAGGSLDIAYSDVGSILKVAQQGLPLKIIAPSGTVFPASRGGAEFLVSANGPIQSLADVKGKRVVVNQLNNIVNLYVLAALDNIGVAPGSYSIMELPYPQMPDALLNGRADMIAEVDPFVTILLDSGKVRNFGSATYGIHPDLRIAAYVAGDKWLKQNVDLAKRFQRAYARSVEYTMKNVDKHADWQIKFFGLKPELKSKVVLGKFADTDLSPGFMDSLSKTKDLMLKYKYLEKDLDLNSLAFR
jgi:NitT/TauT family transport system substrate-binding protein